MNIVSRELTGSLLSGSWQLFRRVTVAHDRC